MDMNSTNPRVTLSVSADLKLVDATGREFDISIHYAGSLEVSTPRDAWYTNTLRVLHVHLAIQSSRTATFYQ